MATADGEKLEWFAYRDEEGYWIESSRAPCLSLWTPLRSVWDDAVEAIDQMLDSGVSPGDKTAEQKSRRKVKRLRSLQIGDPIYDYINVPPPVRYSLDPTDSRKGPLFLQRLRYIKQNGSAYLVFPSLRSGRFEHSLGAMQLARRISDSIFQVSETSTVEKFSDKLRQEFAQGPQQPSGDPPPERADRKTWLACFRQIHRPDDGKDREPGSPESWDTDHELCEQLSNAMRMHSKPLHLRRVGELSEGSRHVVSKTCALHFFKLTASLLALLHDVGHLPFSHTLEDPLEDLLREKGSIVPFPTKKVSDKAIHERISLEIVRGAGDLFTSEAWQIAVLLALLAHENTQWEQQDGVWIQSSVFATLHSIVSSEVDVDRLDFVARDGYESGAAIGRFDLPRIIRSTSLYRKQLRQGEVVSGATNCRSGGPNSPEESRGGDDNPSFGIAFKDYALGEIEGLLFERFKLYRNITDHHKVKFFDAALGALYGALESQLYEDTPNVPDHQEGSGTQRAGVGLLEGAFVNPPTGFTGKEELRLRHDDTQRPNILNNPLFAWRRADGELKVFNPDYLIDVECGGSLEETVGVFFDDNFVVRRIRQAQFNSELLRDLREAFLLRRPLSFSLWKRRADFRPVRERLFVRVAASINAARAIDMSVTDRQVQKFLALLPTKEDGRCGMRWMFKEFSRVFKVISQKNLACKYPSWEPETEELIRIAGRCGAIVIDTARRLFSELKGLRIMAVDGPPFKILELSSALQRLRLLPNEIGYFVFVVGRGVEELHCESGKKRDAFRDLALEHIFYDTLSQTVVNFLTMSTQQVDSVWGKDKPLDYPWRLFEDLSS